MAEDILEGVDGNVALMHTPLMRCVHSRRTSVKVRKDRIPSSRWNGKGELVFERNFTHVCARERKRETQSEKRVSERSPYRAR